MEQISDRGGRIRRGLFRMRRRIGPHGPRPLLVVRIVTKREATREALFWCALVLDTALGEGWALGWALTYGDSPEKAEKVGNAVEEVISELKDRSKVVAHRRSHDTQG